MIQTTAIANILMIVTASLTAVHGFAPAGGAGSGHIFATTTTTGTAVGFPPSFLYLFSLEKNKSLTNPTLSSISSFSSFFPSNTKLYAEAVVPSKSHPTPPSIDAKEAVKVFGRLAEKYIMLDDTGGMCCYSACSDCEFRLPDGGYKMADQSASRPKWIPCYEERKFVSLGKEHVTNWSKEIFCDGPCVTKEEFVERVKGMAFSPPLGGPYMSASSAGIEDDFVLERLFGLLAGEGKEKLTRHRMGRRMKELGGGTEGWVWSDFLEALTRTPVVMEEE